MSTLRDDMPPDAPAVRMQRMKKLVRIILILALVAAGLFVLANVDFNMIPAQH